MLLDAGADVDHHGPLGETALHRACQSDGISADMVELMLFKGANPNAVTYAGDLPLHFACQVCLKLLTKYLFHWDEFLGCRFPALQSKFLHHIFVKNVGGCAEVDLFIYVFSADRQNS